MLPIYQELIAAGIKIWVFSGDTDAVVPVTARRYSIDALKLPTVVNWYPWYDHGKVSTRTASIKKIQEQNEFCRRPEKISSEVSRVLVITAPVDEPVGSRHYSFTQAKILWQHLHQAFKHSRLTKLQAIGPVRIFESG